MRGFPALLLILMLSSAALAATTTRLGRIVDEAGKPLEGAVISDGQQSVFSAPDGTFYIYTASDSLSVQRLGYFPRRVAFRDLVSPVVLHKEPILLPKVVVSETAQDLIWSAADRVLLAVDPDRHYYSAGELLGSSASAHSNDLRLKGESQSISLLGNLPRHSLILLDGVPLNPDGQGFDLSLLEPQDIESVDIIRNNASVYGGSSAIGGLVRVKTRKAEGQSRASLSLGSELGSFGYARNSLSYSVAKTAWDFRFSLSNLNTDNDFRYKVPSWWAADSSAIRRNNAKRQNSLALSLGRNAGSGRLCFQTEYISFHRQLPGTVNFLEVYRNAYLKGSTSRNRLSCEGKWRGWEPQGVLWLNLDSTLYDNTQATLPVFLSKYRQRMLDLGLRGMLTREYPLSRHLSMPVGATAEAGLKRYQNLNLLASGADLDQRAGFANASLKAALKYDRDTISGFCSGAMRYDWQDPDDALSWRLEGSLRHYGWVQSTLGATWGTSFSLPSPYDLYWKGDSQAIGNPDLKSETSRGWQAWLENKLGAFSLKAAWHHNSIDRLIQWRQIQLWGNVWKPLNIGRARIRNLELEARLEPLDWLSLSAGGLYTQALDLSAAPPDAAPQLMYTPKTSYTLAADISWKSLRCWSRYSFTGEQYATPDNLAAPLDSYGLLDFGATLDLNLQGWILSPQINIHNVLNSRYEVYAYVPQPGIALYGGVTLSRKE